MKKLQASSSLVSAASCWRVLDNAHRKRNLSEYEGHLDIDEALVAAVIRAAHQILDHLNQTNE